MTPTTVSNASPTQRDIWRQRAQQGSGASAWASVAANCGQTLDAGTARTRLEAVLARHDVLRAAYHSDENGILCFASGNAARIDVEAPDWSDWNAASIAAEQARLLDAVRRRDAGQVDAQLVCASLPDGHSWLLLALPSLNADLTTALQVLQGVADGQPAEGEDIQYADVADWLNDFLVNEELAEARGMWDPAWTRQALAPEFGLRQYRGGAGGELATLAVDLSGWRDRRQQQGEQGEPSPAFADAVCAGLRLALQAYAEQPLLARTIDLRNGALLAAPGQISRTVPLQVPHGADLEQAARNEASQLAQYRDYVECYARPAGSGAFPFVFSSTAGNAGFEVVHAHAASEAAMLDFVLVETSAQATLWIHYDRGWVDDDALRQFAAHFQAIADGRTPAGSVLSGPVVADRQSRANVVEWFAATAASGNGRIVVEQDGAPGRAVALADIERRANRVANHLIGAGLAKGDLVALRLPSSDDFVVAMLALLKAGAAYVPIDTVLPPARVASMLAESAPRFVIHAELPPDAAPNALAMGAIEAAASDERAPAVAIGADDLAYVLYTSGSTGHAKGIAVRHDALVNHMAWMIAEFGFGPQDVFMQRTSVSFDASIWEFWAPLLAGGTLLTVPRDINHSPAQMSAALRQHGVTVLQLVPSLLAVLLEQGGIAVGACLRQLFLGGEALPTRLAREAAQRIGCDVVNLYGPSECCIQITYERYDAALLTEQVPIGQPINNVSCIVLRADGQLAAAGQEGELLVSGRCLFAGYLAQPELTAQAWAEIDGKRYYRSGDWVRVLPDNKLYFIERKDQQIKHNGYRIELDEISQLAETAGLARHAVCTYDKARKQLSLFVIAPTAGNESILAQLRARLPEYMVPSTVLAVAEFPRLSSGKIDRKELARRAADAASANYSAPETPVEQALAGIWQQLLGLSTAVGIDTGFFTIGGDSLLAMRLSSRIGEHFGVDVKMRAIFENDTIRALAAHIGAQHRTVTTLAPRAEPALPAPLSFAQQRLWFVDQLEGGSAAYNVPRAFRLRGALDADALRTSLTAIVARHEVLRSAISAGAEQAVQQVRAAAAAPFAFTSLEQLADEERDGALRALLAAMAGGRFDLGGDVLLRAHLVRLAADDHVLALNMPHIVSDGWSQAILMRELSALYAAGGSPDAALPVLELQYADFALWQRAQLDGGEAEAKLAYWKARLDGIPEVHNLPLDYPRGAGRKSGSATRAMLLPPELQMAIAAFCRQRGVTQFMFLQSALAVLLSRYSNETDIVIGTPVSGRMDRRLEALIGCFVNSLVIRNDLSDNPTFNDFLQHAKQACLDAQANQEIPFDLLVEALNPERSLSYNPLFQVMLVSENADGGSLSLDGLSVDPVPFDTGAAKFDLLLGASDSEAGLRLAWTYDTALFAQDSILRMAANFEHLLRAIVARPDTRIAALPLLAEQERATLLHDWNRTAANYSGAPTLAALFEAQAAATPDQPALGEGSDMLSYAELNLRANRLAHYLREQGVGAGSLVGLCMRRSTGMVAALLAILKAGAAYLPLDPDHPPARLAYMVGDAQIALMLTRAADAGALPTQGVRLLDIDAPELAAGVARQSAGNPQRDDDAAAPACAIYTSGSTGTPKAVLMPHRAIVNRLHWMRSAFPAAADEVYCQKTSLNFVDHVAEIFQPLTQGTPLVVIGDDAVRDIDLLVEALARHRISRITLVPSLLDVLADHPALGELSLRYVISSGEPLTAQLAARVKAALPQARLLNIYGSTEVGADVTCDEYGEDGISIGRPIANNRAYILDGQGALLPQGAVGELHIAGAGLALGYLHQPELSAARFVADPFGGPGARLYRTGDLARWLPDGRLSYQGRQDHQIKLRGMRIEAGEVEAQLRLLAGVRDAVVSAGALEGEARAGRLLAYIVATADGAPTAAACRKALRQVLPEYMVPDVYLFLDALPLTRTGKIDRKALPAPTAADVDNARYVAPRDATEAALCKLWEKLLKRERVGIEDNFFESGGHSLLATRLLSQIRQQLEIELPLRALFEHPTIAALSDTLSTYRRDGAAAIPRADAGQPLALSFAQQRLWFIDQLENGSAEYNLPMQFDVRGQLDVSALQRALDTLVARHEVLRTAIAMADGQAIQTIRGEGAVLLRQHDLRGLDALEQPQELARIAAADAASPFDLGADVLLRAHLFRLDQERHRIFLNLPHIAADGWSLGILFHELNTLYNAYAQGQASPLAAPPVRYADYAQWQRATLQGAALERHLSYWRDQLHALPAMHSLPLDRQRPARQRFQGKCHAQVLDGELLAAVQALCQREQVTLFMLLQTAFAVLLHRYSNEDDIVIGTPIAGRTHREVEQVVGLFVNSLVLRSDLSGNPPFSAQLRRNKQMILDAYEHQAVPFEMLVEQLQPERSMSHTPLFQVTLTLQNNEQQQLAFHGLELERNVTSHNRVKCDLELTVTEADGRLYLDWDYNVDLFARASIERMAANFEVLVRGIVAQPDAALAALPVVSAVERRRLLEQWNDSAAGYPDSATVHALFRAQAGATPTARALTDGTLDLSYAELEARANRLAHYLRQRGAGAGSVVGVCMERSASMVVAMLAIMKAGAAYLPLDPAHPAARLAHLIGDAGAALVLSETPSCCALPVETQAVLLDDIAQAAQLAAFSDSVPSEQASAGDPACVIYTSGSTGKPKGVLVPHRAIVNRLAWMRRVFPPASGEVYSQKTSLNFVDHVAEIFQPLVQGSPLVLIPDAAVRDIDLLIGTLRAYRVSRLTLVPSLLALLLEHEDAGTLSDLRYLTSSGEPLSGALAAKATACLPHATLLNLYGSTEVGADATCFVAHAGAPAEVMRYFPRQPALGCGLAGGAPTPLALAAGSDVTTPNVRLASLLADFGDTATPESAQPFERYVDYLNDQVLPHLVNVAAPTFIGHMTSQLPSFMAEFARVLTVLNQNMVKIETSKSLTLAERQAVAMVHRQFFDLPEQVYADHAQAPHSIFGLVTSGGTTSNITAMQCARNKALRALGHTQAEIAAKGATALLHAAGQGPGVIIGSRLAHYSIRKAANLLGLGEENILLIDQDDEQRLSMAHLVATIERCRAEGRLIIAMIGMAGATETGTIDPLPEMARIAQRYGLHFHVDAAWGGAARFSARFRNRLRGIERADTVTFCGHKQMYLPQGISLLLFREPCDTGILPVHTAYQAARGTFDMGQHTLEGSRPATALLLHAALHLLGRQGYGWLVDQSMAQAEHFAALVDASGAFELVGRPHLNIVNYRYIPAALRSKKYSRFSKEENAAIDEAVEAIQQEQFLRAKTFVSKTRVLHHPTGDAPVQVFRVVFSNPLVSFADLREVLRDQLQVAADVVEQGSCASLADDVLALQNHVADSAAAPVPAGAAIDNMRIYLLDRNGQLLPQGAVGEVYIGGPGLALGYLNRPELTAERFIDSPFRAGERLFRTGDHARWLPDGALQYCGRRDAQCKVRGTRVEPGEIEAALLRVDGVRQAVVAANGGQLVAYIALESALAGGSGEEALRGLALRSELRRTLPDYMVPELFVLVDSFATTATGKIDRQRLPAGSAPVAAGVIAPRDAVERALSAIWGRLLKREQVGVKCNFFELGGHSLLAMTAINHIRKRLGVRLPLMTLFEYPDIEGVANVIRALSDGSLAQDGAGNEEQVDLLL